MYLDQGCVATDLEMNSPPSLYAQATHNLSESVSQSLIVMAVVPSAWTCFKN